MTRLRLRQDRVPRRGRRAARLFAYEDCVVRAGPRILSAARCARARQASGGRRAAVDNSAFDRGPTGEFAARRYRAGGAAGDKARAIWRDIEAFGGEPHQGMGRWRRRVRNAPADDRASQRERTDNEDRSGDEVSAADGPGQERSSEHVPNEAPTRHIALSPQLVLKVQQLIAIPIADPPRIQLEQRARQTRTHAAWTPSRASPTRVIFSSCVSWSISAAVPSAVIS